MHILKSLKQVSPSGIIILSPEKCILHSNTRDREFGIRIKISIL